MGRIGDWLRGYRRVRVIATIPIDRLATNPIKSTQDDEIPEYDRKLTEFRDKNSIEFPGWDSLILYWDKEKDKLVFLQEFGGHNELEDEHIENMIDLCMRFLRRSENGAGHYLQ